VRLSRHDPRTLGDCVTTIKRRIGEGVSRRTIEALVNTVERTWENYFHIGEPFDLAFELGVVLYLVGSFESAIGMFVRSLALSGDDERTHWNMGLCHLGAQRPDDASRCFAEVMRLRPGIVMAGFVCSK
jgi:hypothetical protein